MNTATNTEHTVPQAAEWLVQLLERNGVAYEVIPHRRDFTARETAADTQTSRLEFAKTVIVEIGLRQVMLVLPPHHQVDLQRVADAFGGMEATLVPEGRLASLFPDCEVGAMPPFGWHYRLPVLVAAAMAMDEHITFNAGSHEIALRIGYADFERLVQPRVANFSTKDGLKKMARRT